jgi:hypothetical protein
MPATMSARSRRISRNILAVSYLLCIKHDNPTAVSSLTFYVNIRFRMIRGNPCTSCHKLFFQITENIREVKYIIPLSCP